MKLGRTGSRVGFIGVLGLGAIALAGPASAGTLSLTCDLLAPGTGTACPATAPMYAVPGQYANTREFTGTDATGQIAGSNIYAGPAKGSLGPAGFIDDYFFNIEPANVDAVSASIQLGGSFSISNLFMRIYTLAANPGGLVKTTPNGPVDYGTVQQVGAATLAQITPTMLGAGSYVLEISGTSNGSLGGNYTGSLQLQAVPPNPVPLPAALPLLLAGLGLTGGSLRRRRAAAASSHA